MFYRNAQTSNVAHIALQYYSMSKQYSGINWWLGESQLGGCFWLFVPNYLRGGRESTCTFSLECLGGGDTQTLLGSGNIRSCSLVPANIAGSYTAA